VSRKPTVTGPQRIERERRIAAILSMRVAGHSLQAIGDAQDPPVTPQAIHKCIKQAIERMADEAVEEARRIESLRLDEATAAVYPGVSAGDLASIDRMLDLMRRRARLLGLDMPTRWAPGVGDNYNGPDTPTGIEIINNPEIEHMRRLEAALEALGEPPRVTSLPSLN
jgi:hypothetical protein